MCVSVVLAHSIRTATVVINTIMRMSKMQLRPPCHKNDHYQRNARDIVKSSCEAGAGQQEQPGERTTTLAH